MGVLCAEVKSDDFAGVEVKEGGREGGREGEMREGGREGGKEGARRV